MAVQIPARPTDSWYQQEPLQGTGTSGSFKEVDFLKALQITRVTYIQIRIRCMAMLDEFAPNSHERLDLRTEWNSRSRGGNTKRAMVKELVDAHIGVFQDVSRFTSLPPNWDKVRMLLAEQCIISANQHRSRTLPRQESSSRRCEIPNGTTPDNSVGTAPTTTRRGPAERSLSQPDLAEEILHLAQTTTYTLNNLTIPVIFDDETQDIAAFHLRPSVWSMETPHFSDQVSLKLFKEAIKDEFLRDPPFHIRARNSVGEHRIIRNDQQLKTSLTRWLSLIHSGSGQLAAEYFIISSTSHRAGTNVRGTTIQARPET